MNSSEGNKSGTREYPLKYLAWRVNKIAPTVQHFMISMVVDTEIYRYIVMGDSHPWDSSDSFSWEYGRANEKQNRLCATPFLAAY